MSEAHAQVQEEQEADNGPIKADNKPDGKDAVDFNELPEEVRDKFEARFKRVYGNMKEYERIARTLEKDQKALIQRLEKVETTQVQDRAEQRIESIKSQTQAALESGDIDKAKELQDQLANYIKEFSAPPEKPKAEEKEEAYIPPEAANAIQHWANDIDDDGNFKRPWAQPQHGRYDDAIAVAQKVYDRMQGYPVEEILSAIDKQITTELFPKKQTRAQAVLSADGAVTPSSEKGAKLTDDQKEAARFLYPKLAPKEAEARYAKALKEG